MITSQEYDTSYDPAMPIVEIGISKATAHESEIMITALIDSGSDVTMIPLSVLEDVGARYVTKRQMSGVTGHSITVHQFLVAVHIGTKVIHRIYAIGHETLNEAIVGRDFLNQLRVTLDGPAETAEFE